MNRKPYPTYLTDAQWGCVQPLAPRPKSGGPNGGRPPTDYREALDATFCHPRGGQAWRMLPHDFPPWQAVYGLFRLWRIAGAGGEGPLIVANLVMSPEGEARDLPQR